LLTSAWSRTLLAAFPSTLASCWLPFRLRRGVLNPRLSRRATPICQTKVDSLSSRQATYRGRRSGGGGGVLSRFYPRGILTANN
jgi:hypothetical protein